MSVNDLLIDTVKPWLNLRVQNIVLDGTDNNPNNVATINYVDTHGGGGGATWGSITGTLSSQTDLQTALNTKLNLAGGTMTGAIAMGTNKVTNIGNATVATDAMALGQHTTSNLAIDSNLNYLGTGFTVLADTPVTDDQVATKYYVDTQVITAPSTGFTLSSNLAGDANNYKIINLATGTNANDAVNKTQLDTKLNLAGGTLTGTLDMGSNKVTTTYVPVNDEDLVNKLYADGLATGATWGSITGTLSSQTDLQTALDDKLNLAGGTMTGLINMGANTIENITDSTFSNGVVSKQWIEDNKITNYNVYWNGGQDPNALLNSYSPGYYINIAQTAVTLTANLGTTIDNMTVCGLANFYPTSGINDGGNPYTLTFQNNGWNLNNISFDCLVVVTGAGVNVNFERCTFTKKVVVSAGANVTFNRCGMANDLDVNAATATLYGCPTSYISGTINIIAAVSVSIQNLSFNQVNITGATQGVLFTECNGNGLNIAGLAASGSVINTTCNWEGTLVLDASLQSNANLIVFSGGNAQFSTVTNGLTSGTTTQIIMNDVTGLLFNAYPFTPLIISTYGYGFVFNRSIVASQSGFFTSQFINFQEVNVAPLIWQNLDMNANRIVDMADPIDPTDAVTKQYADSLVSTGFPISVDTDVNSGTNVFELNKMYTSTVPTVDESVANKLYVDTQDALKLNLTGGTLTGTLDMGSNKVTTTYVPVNNEDLVNKQYADGLATGATWGSITGTLSSQTDLQTALNDKLNLAGGTMTGTLDMGSNKVTTTYVPVNNEDLVNKQYVDAEIAGVSISASQVNPSLNKSITATLSGNDIVVNMLDGTGTPFSALNPGTLIFRNKTTNTYYAKNIETVIDIQITAGTEQFPFGRWDTELSSQSLVDDRYMYVYAVDAGVSNTISIAVSMDWLAHNTMNSMVQFTGIAGTSQQDPMQMYWEAADDAGPYPCYLLGRFKGAYSTGTNWTIAENAQVLDPSLMSPISSWWNFGTPTLSSSAIPFITATTTNPSYSSTMTGSYVTARRNGSNLEVKAAFRISVIASTGTGAYKFLIPGFYKVNSLYPTAAGSGDPAISNPTTKALAGFSMSGFTERFGVTQGFSSHGIFMDSTSIGLFTNSNTSNTFDVQRSTYYGMITDIYRSYTACIPLAGVRHNLN